MVQRQRRPQLMVVVLHRHHHIAFVDDRTDGILDGLTYPVEVLRQQMHHVQGAQAHGGEKDDSGCGWWMVGMN